MNNKSQQRYSLLKKADLFYQLIKKAVPLDEGGLVISPHLSPERMNEIPAIKDYIKHYSNTNILYRIIYCNSEFNLTTRPITVSSFIASLQEKIKTSSMSERDKEEAQYLLDNNAFNQNAINIIENNLDKIKNEFETIILLEGYLYSDSKKISSGSIIVNNKEYSLLTKEIEVLCFYPPKRRVNTQPASSADKPALSS